jgi:hypothetical protein
MTTTVRYLLAGGVALLGAVIVLILWHLQAGSSLRRIRRDLGDLNPRIRRAAVLALKERDLAPVVDRLVALTKSERDADVLAAIAEVTARTAWQPADSPALVELRTWAGITGGNGGSHRIQPPVEVPEAPEPPSAPAVPVVPVAPIHPTPADVTATDFGVRHQPLGDLPPDAASSAAALIDSVLGQVAAATEEAERVAAERTVVEDDPWAILSEPIAAGNEILSHKDSAGTPEVTNGAAPIGGAALELGGLLEDRGPRAEESKQIVLLVHTGKKSKKKQKKTGKKGSKKKG